MIITVVIASLFLGKAIKNNAVITGVASISGEVGEVMGIREKAQAAVKFSVDNTNVTNLIIPYANTVDDCAIWSSFTRTVMPEVKDGAMMIQRDWFAMSEKDQKLLNVYAAKSLDEVLELAIVCDVVPEGPPPAEVHSILPCPRFCVANTIIQGTNCVIAASLECLKWRGCEIGLFTSGTTMTTNIKVSVSLYTFRICHYHQLSSSPSS